MNGFIMLYCIVCFFKCNNENYLSQQLKVFKGYNKKKESLQNSYIYTQTATFMY